MWEAAQNWLLFGAIAGGLAYYYYYPTATKLASKTKSAPEPPTAAPKRRNERDTKQIKRPAPSVQSGVEKESGTNTKAIASNDSKKHPAKRVHVQAPADPVVVTRDDEPEEVDMSTRQFAQQMAKARQGNSLQAPKGKAQKLRTVKQGSAKDNQAHSSASSQAGGEADDDLSPVPSPALRAGDVADMLEPSAAPPTTLRIVGEVKPQPQRREKKEQAVETKKQRQNRLKVEERKVQREEEEKQRRVLEERQRRAAREARGEPAKNGISIPAAPAQNPWSETRTANGPIAPGNVHASSGALLDTFDVESTGSSNGVLGVSTAATSATDGSISRFDNDISEEEQMARAMKQSENESGWQTVNVAKKPKKKATEAASPGDSTSVATTISDVKKPAPSAKASTNSKPNGYQVLDMGDVQQNAGGDPDDIDSWTA